MAKLIPISSKQYSLWLDRYTEQAEPGFDLLSVPPDLPDDLQAILQQDYPIQCALYHFATTRSTGMNLTLSYPEFTLSHWASFFPHITALSFGKTQISLDLSRPESDALHLFRQCLSENLLHPLIQESMRTYFQRGEIPIRAQWTFMEFIGGSPASQNTGDLLITSLHNAPGKGTFDIPAYLTEQQIKENPFFMSIRVEADRLVFIGHMEKGQFISHAAIAFYDHPAQDMTSFRTALQASRPDGSKLSCTTEKVSCFVRREIDEKDGEN